MSEFSAGPVKTDIFEEMNMTNEMRDDLLEEMIKDMALRRANESEETTKHIAFLESDDSFITGTNLLDDRGVIWGGSVLRIQKENK